jgi:RNA polymerase sigma-70 factor (ECF subfamily)
MNRSELETLVRSHQAEIYRYLRYLGASDASVAEDLVQDTFLAAFRSPVLPTLTEQRQRSAWLRGVARNLFLAHCRRSQRSPVRADSAVLEQAESLWESEFLRGGDGFDYLEALRHCLTQLGDKQRRLLDLRYARKKSRAEMARLLQMTEDGIKSALQRLRAALGECIHRRQQAEMS